MKGALLNHTDFRLEGAADAPPPTLCIRSKAATEAQKLHSEGEHADSAEAANEGLARSERHADGPGGVAFRRLGRSGGDVRPATPSLGEA